MGDVGVKRAWLVLLLVLACCSRDQTIPEPGAGPGPGSTAKAAREKIESIATASQCGPRIGSAPKAYMRGVALVFARSVCERSRADVKVVAAAKSPEANVRTDALTWYDSKFRALGMSNDSAGVDTLRHAYAMLLDLGIRESSGRYCLGRYLHDPFNTADSAEAGLFQTSWGASARSSVLPAMFERYQADQSGCLLDTFSRGVSCGAAEAKNWGDGKGAEWQKLTKVCPAFATEYAAVVLRANGGSMGEYGPIRQNKVQIEPVCDSMLLDVQRVVEASPAVCSAL